MRNDTIAAIATAMTNSGIGIIRISGVESIDIVKRIYKGKKLEDHQIHYGYIYDGKEAVDEVLVMVMKGPRSFTGEDTVEINCHGGVYVVKRILETVIKYGARPAEPGEFTKRAFLNGKIDLSQAEAVIDVISSKNEYALQSSLSQLKGNIQKKIKEIREQIIYHTAFIETALDDPEHISLDGFTNELKTSIMEVRERLYRLIASAENGRMLKEGIRTVILGRPNVGKSSLMNLFAGEERAIVTDIAGTTRDTIEETVTVRGIALSLIDTAGIRSTEDIVEKIGVEKAKKAAEEADLILYLADATAEVTEEEKEILSLIADKKSIILLNKIDLCETPDTSVLEKLTGQKVLCISAKEEEGLDALYDTIEAMFFRKELSYNDDLYITGERQKQSLQSAYDAMGKVLESIEADMPEDFYSIDLMQGYESLGEITGESVDEDLVNTIFREFCMGK